MRGVCCYRYKFFIDTGTRRRWLHDPRQPMDKHPDGWVNNFMCKYAHSRDGQLQKSEVPTRTIAAIHVLGTPSAQPPADGKTAEAGSPAQGGRSTSTDADSGAAALVEQPACLILPATYFNGSTLRTTSTRVMWVATCCALRIRTPLRSHTCHSVAY